ncbi:hypothetical protein D9M71_616690 [compost metagenome]
MSGAPSSQRSTIGQRRLISDRLMSMPIRVTITSSALVMEKSLPSSACWVASLMISSSTKSNRVRSDSEWRPAILKMISRAK